MSPTDLMSAKVTVFHEISRKTVIFDISHRDWIGVFGSPVSSVLWMVRASPDSARQCQTVPDRSVQCQTVPDRKTVKNSQIQWKCSTRTRTTVPHQGPHRPAPPPYPGTTPPTHHPAVLVPVSGSAQWRGSPGFFWIQ